MPNCDKCIWSIRSGHCVLFECKFVSFEDARRIMEEKERKDEKTVSSMSMTLDEAIVYVETVARANESIVSNYESDKRRSKTYRQLAAYLRELQERRKQPEIIFCKDCRKHNVRVGYEVSFKTNWRGDACPLADWRGKAQGHEFDYQYCVYAERRTDGQRTGD